jgi:hypothetical protein
MKYKFTGKPDRVFPQLKTGNVYDLELAEKNFVGMSKGWKVYPITITSPILCPYSSWETFYKNWKPVK